MICFSQLRMRGIILRESPDKLIVRMWLFPYLTWATIAMISFVLVYMLTDKDGREQVILSALVAALVVAFALVRDRLVAGRAVAPAASSDASAKETAAP
ncbi:Amino acid ABC transporter permease OS=Streptomyces antimycoticus OX=68175 GN=SANT12839_036190 PE=3 SV=1 [Streptomyces antimycoticus]